MTDVIFLPGIIAPAALRYGPLLEHLPGVNAVVKDLEVYAGDTPPAGYSIETEVLGIDDAADRAGLHHLNTSHQAEPARTAQLLQRFWAR